MNIKEIYKQIKAIDEELQLLEKEEIEEKEIVEREKIDQTEEALKTLKEVVGEINTIEDLKSFRENDKQLYKNMILTVVSWFNYLKKEKHESPKYEEAKNLVISIGEKHPMLHDWCKVLIEKPLITYESTINLNDLKLNINESSEYQIKEDLKVVFDYEQVKKYAEIGILSEHVNTRELNYKVIYKDEEYSFRHYYENYLPKWEFDEECPYRVTIIDVDADGIISFNVITWKNIPKEN